LTYVAYDIEQNLRRTEQEQSVILAREKYEVDKVLEIDDKVKELKNISLYCTKSMKGVR
jgi:hypothetical protein